MGSSYTRCLWLWEEWSICPQPYDFASPLSTRAPWCSLLWPQGWTIFCSPSYSRSTNFSIIAPYIELFSFVILSLRWRGTLRFRLVVLFIRRVVRRMACCFFSGHVFTCLRGLGDWHQDYVNLNGYKVIIWHTLEASMLIFCVRKLRDKLLTWSFPMVQEMSLNGESLSAVSFTIYNIKHK